MEYSEEKQQQLDPRLKFKKMSQYFTLIFVLVYFIVTSLHPFRFGHSTVFIVLACYISYIGFQKNLSQFGLLDIGNLFDYQGLLWSIWGRGLFIINAVINSGLAREKEHSSRMRYKAKQAMGRIEVILNTLMPPLVVEELRTLTDPSHYPSHHYQHSTIAQSDLCGFTQLSSTRTPLEVVDFIGDLFGLFDVLTDKYGVYKVETVGDAYVAGQADKPL